MTVVIAPLRAIGAATHAKMPIKVLQDACETAGLGRVATYIRAGNLIFETRKSAATARVPATSPGSPCRERALGRDT